jgi:hypothetical protein
MCVDFQTGDISVEHVYIPLIWTNLGRNFSDDTEWASDACADHELDLCQLIKHYMHRRICSIAFRNNTLCQASGMWYKSAPAHK